MDSAACIYVITGMCDSEYRAEAVNLRGWHKGVGGRRGDNANTVLRNEILKKNFFTSHFYT